MTNAASADRPSADLNLQCTLGSAPPVANLDSLNRLAEASGANPPRFVEQTRALLADGLHYEERIARHGVVATRSASPHDLFNAWIWLQYTPIKRAMNARQVADIARVGRTQRTRGQCALTHFDEAGAIVWIASPDALAAWNAHDWKTLFRTHGAEWGARIAVTIVGHALYEYALVHEAMPVARSIAVAVDADELREHCAGTPVIACWEERERWIADEIASGKLLADPQELRPLPLAGIPGWQAGAEAADFFDVTPCFRPLRSGRQYPAPIRPPTRDACAVRAIA